MNDASCRSAIVVATVNRVVETVPNGSLLDDWLTVVGSESREEHEASRTAQHEAAGLSSPLSGRISAGEASQITPGGNNKPYRLYNNITNPKYLYVMSMNTCLDKCLHKCPYTCLEYMSAHIFMQASIQMSIHTSKHMSVHMSIHMSIYMSMHMFIHMFIHMSMHLSMHMSTHTGIFDGRCSVRCTARRPRRCGQPESVIKA